MQQPEKVVITFGTFDLLHLGHLRILERARSQGDRLVVGVSTDELNFRKKGKRPFYDQETRKEMLRHVRWVDDVFDEESLEAKPDYCRKFGASVLVMGDDWEGKFDDMPVANVVYFPRTEGISTTSIKAELRSQ